MATLSPAKGYSLPTVGGDSNLWGSLLNGDFNIVDRNLGGNLSISVAGGAGSTTLTAVQAQNLIIECTGVLTGNRNIVSPAAGGIYIYKNSTSGNFTLTAITSAGGSTGPVLPQGGEPVLVFSDGTDITLVAALPNVYAGTSGGSANVQTLNLSLNAVGAGTSVIFLAGFTNTGATTLNGTAVVLPGGSALQGGEIVSGAVTQVVHNGTSWILTSVYSAQGTWTPTLTLGGGSVTYTTQYGEYKRFGNYVWFTFKIVINVATAPSGALTVSLPFTAKNVSNSGAPGVVQTLDTTAGTYGSQLRVLENTATALIYNIAGSPSAAGDLGGALANGVTIYGSGSFIV